MRQELQDVAREKSSSTTKKKSLTVYCKPYFKDSSGLVSNVIFSSHHYVSEKIYVRQLKAESLCVASSLLVQTNVSSTDA